MKIIILSFILCLSWCRAVQVTPEPHTFSLFRAANTSAGVYTADGTLVRTLWNNVSYPKGKHTISWDHKDDFGHALNGNDFVIKVLSANVETEWHAAIGNNSAEETGPSVHRGYDHIWDMVAAGKYMYYCREYAEGNPSAAKFLLIQPHKKINIKPLAGVNIEQATNLMCTDGTNIYMAGRDPFSKNNQVSFVFAINALNNKETEFGNGKRDYVNESSRYHPKSVIDFQDNPDGHITGLAVQKNGSYLFIAHQRLNQIHVLNKVTGALVQTINIAAPGHLAADDTDHIWVATNIGIKRFLINKNGTLTLTPIQIDRLQRPLAMDISPDRTTIIVADGGSSQQLKAYNATTGAWLWTYGKPGGYLYNAQVARDKFYFSDKRGLDKPAVYGRIEKGVDHTFVRFAPDGSFWVGDSGNNRAMHFAANKKYLDEIMYQPHGFNSTVDKNNPKRVFCNYLEFEIDYNQPFRQSWRLVRNWGGAIPADYMVDSGGFDSMVTLSNGRTYAFLRNPKSNKNMLVELQADHTLRLTGIMLDNTPKQEIFGDGSLRKFVNPFATAGESMPLNQAKFQERKLAGFNQNNPQWGPVTDIAVVDNVTKDDALDWYDRGLQTPAQKTDNNIFISFDASLPRSGVGNSLRYHLAGVRQGSHKWLWRTALATATNYDGPFPVNGGYDIGNHVVYAGSNALVAANLIVWGYHGEFWKNSQVAKWNIVEGTLGLSVAQFGVTGRDQGVKDHEAAARMAGNAFNPSLIKRPDGTLILINNDESAHGGLHLTYIRKLNTIHVQTIKW